MSAPMLRGSVLIMGLLMAGTAAASGQLECTSHNYQYQYCPANTQNSVHLGSQQSKTACQKGRNWGYDGRGIWVNDGCSAIFDYGGGGGGGGHHHDNGGDVAGALAAAVILAAIADSSSSHHHHDNSYNGGQGNYAPPASNVPQWAIGSFSGTDDVSGTPIDISVDRGGNISGYYGHSSLSGQWSGGRAYLGNRGYSASPTGHGIRLVSDDGQMVINLIRG